MITAWSSTRSSWANWSLPGVLLTLLHARWLLPGSVRFAVLVACSRTILHSRHSCFWTALSIPRIRVSAQLSSPVPDCSTSINYSSSTLRSATWSPRQRSVAVFHSRSMFDCEIKFLQALLPPPWWLISSNARCIHVSAAWSVRMRNCLPSKCCLNWLSKKITANNSLRVVH